MKQKPVEENAAFLQREYKTGGKGFTVGDTRYAVWWDEHGITVGKGISALKAAAPTTVSWQEAGERIHRLFHQGQYASLPRQEQAWDNEFRAAAEKVWYFYRDDVRDVPEEWVENGSGFPYATAVIQARLRWPEELGRIIARIEEDAARLDSMDTPFYRAHNTGQLLDTLRDLQRDPLLVQSEAELPQLQPSFITADEIDTFLGEGGRIEDGKFRIYSFFLHDHDGKEKAACLKKEYGDSGWSHALSGADDSWFEGYKHKARGLTLRRSYDEVIIPWGTAAKRVSAMIAEAAYLDAEALEKLPTYEKKELARRVAGAYYQGRYGEAVTEILHTLNEPDQVDRLLQSLKPILDETSPSERIFSYREKAYQDLEAYQDGTFTLFPEKPAPEPDAQVSLFDAGERSRQEEEPLSAPSPLPALDAMPESHSSGSLNYRLDDVAEFDGTPAEKFERNIAAIQTLRQIEREKRPAAPAEQETLSRYVGWGGLPKCFEEGTETNRQLQSLLSPAEYSAARASTLTAFYTPPAVIRAMYQYLERIGAAESRLLEPSCATGHFFGAIPEGMGKMELHGVELDTLSGGIAKALYPNAAIKISGYEKVKFEDNSFDVAVGNVPFGDFSVYDSNYNQPWKIHDYFFGKSLDKVRPGGIVMFITSRGTLDKKSSNVRQYLADRAELLGAVRLPSDTFAGTEVTSDILILQKRERPIISEDSWISLGEVAGVGLVNQYFIERPEMVLGELTTKSGPYGPEITCKPLPGHDLSEQLRDALNAVPGQFFPYRSEGVPVTILPERLDADPTVKNFSYTMVGDGVYFREDDEMTRQILSNPAQARMRGMIDIRDHVTKLIDLQMANCTDEELAAAQRALTAAYDSFTAKHGLLNARNNRLAFDADVSYPLLASLERVDRDGTLKSKSDMFTMRTIRIAKPIDHAETAVEALGASIGERGGVDLAYMRQLTGFTEEKLIVDLENVVYPDPRSIQDGAVTRYLTSDEYLCGNVREKLAEVRELAEAHPVLRGNIAALEQVVPVDLTPAEIDVRLGAAWVPDKYVEQWMFETLETPPYCQRGIHVSYSPLTSNWNVTGKRHDTSRNIRANVTYGTKRLNAYEIIDKTLNLKDVRIFDVIETPGGEVRQFNARETILAQQKQDALKESFRSWIFKDPERREFLARRYNDLYNSTRPRAYDGSHIRFAGMSPLKELREHQANAVARILYGGNTLLAHCVGAGKTYEMIAGAMESKRLGLCAKPLFVVPNHLIGQFSNEFLELYPAANILAAREKDFETANRKKFCARIATGEWDGVIIGHSQFERIPLSEERQAATIRDQIHEIKESIAEAKAEKAENFTVKQMEGVRKRLEAKLSKLSALHKKDQTMDFEQLGIDRLFVDEAHGYKNLFLHTKMRNVAGIGQTEAQKSTDMFAKCRYLDELTGGKGIVFATGTPISNSMTELYTMQRYLQYDYLERVGHKNFDAWASTYGETVTALELAPEGTKHQLKTRFAKFVNLPELMTGWKESADVITADMLDLPVPKAVYHNEVTQPTQVQEKLIQELGERAGRVRSREVDPSKDNMLKITNDGRALALDQRLIHPNFPEAAHGKVSALAGNVYRLWRESGSSLGTQLVFSDLSTPKEKWAPKEAASAEHTTLAKPYCMYHDLKNKLIVMGIPADEIAIIHEADTNAKKQTLFDEMQEGKVRVLIGSTAKLGAGTNVQKHLIALHHVDVPWRPSDIEQREGRIIRQGNENSEVHIYRYVTEGTFDSYSWQVIENKQKFIGQIMTGKAPARSCEDLDSTALSYAEVKALAAGNPLIKERMELEMALAKLKALKHSYDSEIYTLEESILKTLPKGISESKQKLESLAVDIETVRKNSGEGCFHMVVDGKSFAEKRDAGAYLLQLCKSADTANTVITSGMYRGMDFTVDHGMLFSDTPWTMTLSGAGTYFVQLGQTELGNITRMDNVLDRLPEQVSLQQQELETLRYRMADAKEQVKKPWSLQQDLAEKSQRLIEVDVLLNDTAKAKDNGPATENSDELEI